VPGFLILAVAFFVARLFGLGRYLKVSKSCSDELPCDFDDFNRRRKPCGFQG